MLGLLTPGAVLQGRKGGMYSKARQPQSPLILWSYEVGCRLVEWQVSGTRNSLQRCRTLPLDS